MNETREKILQAVRSCGSSYGLTLPMAVDAVGKSRPLVAGHLKALVDAGYITAEPIPTGKRGRPPLAYFPAANDNGR